MSEVLQNRTAVQIQHCTSGAGGLPAELILHILSYMDDACTSSALAKLSLISRHWHEVISNHILYKNIQFSFGASESMEKFATCPSDQQRAGCVGTRTLQFPSLAVCTTAIRRKRPFSSWINALLLSPSMGKMRQIQKKSIFASMLELCPNADHINIGFDTDNLTKREETAFNHFTSVNAGYSWRITSLELCGCLGGWTMQFTVPKKRYRVNIVALLFSFTSLQRLSACHFQKCIWVQPRGNQDELPVKELTLVESDIEICSSLIMLSKNSLSSLYMAAKPKRAIQISRPQSHLLQEAGVLTYLTVDERYLEMVATFFTEEHRILSLELVYYDFLLSHCDDSVFRQLPKSINRLTYFRSRRHTGVFQFEFENLIKLARSAVLGLPALSALHLQWPIDPSRGVSENLVAAILSNSLILECPDIAVTVDMPGIVVRETRNETLSCFGRPWLHLKS